MLLKGQSNELSNDLRYAKQLKALIFTGAQGGLATPHLTEEKTLGQLSELSLSPCFQQ